MMFNEQRRTEVLSAAPDNVFDRYARPAVEAMLRDLLTDHPAIRAVHWTQSLDHPSPEIFVVHDVVIEFTHGPSWNADTGALDGASSVPFDPAAYAVLADLLLAQTDLLVAAFGLGVRVTATASEITTAPCRA